MNNSPVLYVVHCIDTEGPLTEDLSDTFQRINSIFGLSLSPSQETLQSLQKAEIDLGGREGDIARLVAPKLLKYNKSWGDIQDMLHDALSAKFREAMKDDFGQGWVYSWHIMDHVGYSENPRRKDIGFGNVFRFYRDKLNETSSVNDEINWHFHPLSFSRNPLQCATSYENSYDVMLQILSRRIIDEGWFPVAYRPGFNSERPDSHMFLEQWIPFDYANQYYETEESGQVDIAGGRFGDWRRSPTTWRGYHPHHDDYQKEGDCRRWIFRCLSVGTRCNELTLNHVHQAMDEAGENGSAILAFANHDYRDIRPDVSQVRNLLAQAKNSHPDVQIRFSGAADAARNHLALRESKEHGDLKLKVKLVEKVLHVDVVAGKIFGPQPFLAIKAKTQHYYHDNFDFQEPQKSWSYTFDEQTIALDAIESIGVGVASADGFSVVERINLK